MLQPVIGMDVRMGGIEVPGACWLLARAGPQLPSGSCDREDRTAQEVDLGFISQRHVLTQCYFADLPPRTLSPGC